MSTRKLMTMAMLTGIAVTIFMIEAQLPPITTVPGVKLGLANIVTLTALVLFGRREAGMILLVRILLSNVFAGTISAMLYSAAGGALAWVVMSLTFPRLPREQLWVVSILGALAHNLGQLAAAFLILQTAAVLVNLPVLIIAALVSGFFTGQCVYQLDKHTRGRLG